MRKLDQWFVMQDVHDLGETLGIYKEGFRFDQNAHLISGFEPLPRLGALQVLFSSHPYYGRELRYFNQAPWWYRCEFDAEDLEGSVGLLRFLSVDYYCKVYLNGVLAGSHEGYFEPFELNVTSILRSKKNQLFVKVWAPWDHDLLKNAESMRCFSIKRAMVKGTYEHADGFIQRDVNPVGILGDAELRILPGAALMKDWNVDVSYHHKDTFAQVHFQAKACGGFMGRDVLAQLIGPSGKVEAEGKTKLLEDGEIDVKLKLHDPALWNCWDRGKPELYQARLTLMDGGRLLDRLEKKIGVRHIMLERTASRTRFYLNGHALYLRGTSYFPDIYLSEMSYDRYYRDLRLIRDAGFNAVRVHVHVEKDEFYSICDELGLMVIQDSDFNWDHPTDMEWMGQAASVFGAMVRLLKDHPSIICWVALNEPDLWKIFTDGLLEATSEDQIMLRTLCVKLTDTLKTLDPERPYIRASREEEDPESGDSHTYTGSLALGTAYPQIDGTVEKLNTEFGMDVPGNLTSLFRDRNVFEAQRPYFVYNEGLQEYQYRLLRYYVDHYRVQKYAPCSGFFQFMFIDLCPQSFYGVMDFYGIPKKGYYALLESCRPLCLIARRSEKGFRVFVVNDYLRTVEGRVEYSVMQDGICSSSESFEVMVEADSLLCVGEACWDFQKENPIDLYIKFCSRTGKLLAERTYRDAFREFPKMAGQTFDNELGMRTYLFDTTVKEQIENVN